MHTSFESLADGVVVMSTQGDLDVFSAPAFKEDLFRCLDADVRRLVIDMTGSSFIDSTGLGVLVAAAKRAPGRSLDIVCDGGAPRHIFAVVGLDRVFTLYRSRSEALSGAHHVPREAVQDLRPPAD